jgi:hypothetical protein
MMLTDAEMLSADEEKRALLADEFLLVRHSGEIPEVALHSSLYYLTRDPAGPGITLAGRDLALLKDAVQERYREIILRDLDPENRDKGLYRGLARCLANWGRLSRFCRREGRDVGEIRREVAKALQHFIARELEDVLSGSRVSCINCTRLEFEHLLAELGLRPQHDLPASWHLLWPGESQSCGRVV